MCPNTILALYAMCGVDLYVSTLLWILGSAALLRAGQVVAPSKLTARVGHPLILSCGFTRKEGDTIFQVRWYNSQSELILAHDQSVPVQIFHQHDNVELTSSHDGTSEVTIKSVGPEDGGCYSCNFDVYPGGSQEGRICISLTGSIDLDGNRTAISGQTASLSCSYSLPKRVMQVMWWKKTEDGLAITVAYFTDHGPHVEERFRGRFAVSETLGDTRLTLQKVSTEDEACYVCEFHAYPEGMQRATACLAVYVLPKVELHHVSSDSGLTEANCTAVSRPPATVTWDTSGGNQTSSTRRLDDGTTATTSLLSFPSAILEERDVRCIVQHQGLDEPQRLTLHKHVNPAAVVLISVCTVLVLLIMSLCVALQVFHLHKRRR